MSSSAGDVHADKSAFPAPPAVTGTGALTSGFDKLGVVMALIAAAALALPFANFRPSRIGQAQGIGFIQALPAGLAWVSLALLVLGLIALLRRADPRLRLVVAASALLILAVLIGLVPGVLIPPGNIRPRVGPAAGFWLLAFSFAILLTDALVKLSLRPAQRVLALVLTLAGFLAFLFSGHWNGLSIMKEYATNGSGFAANAAVHVTLALASLFGALVVGLPLGIVCQRHRGLRGVVLPALNMIQTIPSLALFGLMELLERLLIPWSIEDSEGLYASS